MSKESLKQAAKTASDATEPAVDSLLSNLLNSPYSWVWVLGYSVMLILTGVLIAW